MQAIYTRMSGASLGDIIVFGSIIDLIPSWVVTFKVEETESGSALLLRENSLRTGLWTSVLRELFTNPSTADKASAKLSSSPRMPEA